MNIDPSLGLVILLFIVGLAFALAEMLVPSFGLLTALSIMSFVGSFIFAFKLGSAYGIVCVLLAALLLPTLIVITFRKLPSTRIGKKLILSSTGQAPDDQPQPEEEDLHDLVGKEGIARSKLRPGGIAEFEGWRVSVISESAFIEPGQRIKALWVDGNQVVVRAVDTKKEEV